MGFIYLWLLERSLQFSSAIEVHVFVRPYSEELCPLPQHKGNSTINQAISVQCALGQYSKAIGSVLSVVTLIAFILFLIFGAGRERKKGGKGIASVIHLP